MSDRWHDRFIVPQKLRNEYKNATSLDWTIFCNLSENNFLRHFMVLYFLLIEIPESILLYVIVLSLVQKIDVFDEFKTKKLFRKKI